MYLDGWRNTKIHLPKYQEIVLLLGTPSHCCLSKIVIGCRTNTDIYGEHFSAIDKVTHWRPLPEKPNEG